MHINLINQAFNSIISSMITMAARSFKLLPILLLALFTFSVSGSVFVSINCGESEFKTDSNFIVWTPDDTLVSNGVARVVQSSNQISLIMDTLRVFTTRKKNCYSTPVTQGEKLLVRASFNYGNYDRLSSPPTFDLHFDGNLWANVKTSLTGLTQYEVIYVAKGEAVSVCVAQTKPNQFPFMTALEIRSVDSDVYSDVDESRALFTIMRNAYGASQSLRFPSDPYDRIWVPSSAGTSNVTIEALIIDPTGPNNPPMGILQNAVTVETTSDPLILFNISPSNDLYYVTMYFSEVTDLGSTKTRAFSIYETTTAGSSPLQLPISPPYGAVLVRDLNNYKVDSFTNISLVARTNSDNPPIINAAEAFKISEVLTDGTDSNDVEALALLQTTFDVLGGWSGDPCLPAPYSWDWLNCSNDATPRVTSLFLDSFDLSGDFPDISSMDALEIIDLSNNTFTGAIPGFLGTMPKLQQLNLADNQFSGSIPTTISKNNKLKLNVTGNPSLCTSGKSCPSSPNSYPGSTNVTKNKKSSSLPIVLGTTIPTFLLVWIVAGVFIILRKRRQLASTNMPNATGGGANGNPNGLPKVGEEVVHEIMENVAQQTFGSPSPLLDTSGQTSDLYRETRV
ncbi:putative leucine-rich repeat receptor-like serine/threonine-protein kinase At2g19230 [Bidens hawaiensis]|uniref:putative leucine-rich repeat receptor-like serine/threonine-protein kinase At2g19230 n=1 Tax=Bidens hawaiensis TaxID=980011 RepID=UPI00404AE11E